MFSGSLSCPDSRVEETLLFMVRTECWRTAGTGFRECHFNKTLANLAKLLEAWFGFTLGVSAIQIYC